MMLLVTLVKTKSEIQNQAQIEDLEKELQFKEHAPTFIRIIERVVELPPDIQVGGGDGGQG